MALAFADFRGELISLDDGSGSFAVQPDGGVALAPGAYEVMFPGLAHTSAVIDEVVAAAHDAAEAISG